LHIINWGEKVASLKEILDELGKQVKQTNKIASRVLKIKGIKRIVVQLNAIPQDGKVRYSLTIHSQNNYRKQLGITANDAEDLKTIADFLNKYADLLNEYIRYTPRNNNAVQEEELNDEEDEENEKEERKERKREKRNVEEEF
jgi:Ran GTPase-activating protein (RanGAP) involved in mRNA processing and transport